jgi:periplasmic protein TonB
VHVSFSVGANGGVSAIRIARSSGYAVLDEAALATVQRAAPFPAIPAGAGRSSWTFSVPLAFSR